MHCVAGTLTDSESFDDPVPAVLASASLTSAPSHSSCSAVPEAAAAAAAASTSIDEDVPGPVGLPPEVIRAFLLQQQQQQAQQHEGEETVAAVGPHSQVGGSATFT